MRKLILFLLVLALPGAGAAWAQTSDVWVSTPYPAMTAASGQELVVDVNVHNVGKQVQRVDLGVQNVPSGWKATYMGDGRPVGAVMVNPGKTVTAELHVTPPADVSEGSYKMAATATTSGQTMTLPLDISMAASLPPKLALTTDFPSLKGVPTADFTYRITISNKGGKQALVNINVDTPKNFTATVTQQYGSHQLTSVAVGPGSKKSVDIKIKPPRNVNAGTYNIVVHAQSGQAKASQKLALVVAGVPQLSINTATNVFSTDGSAGKQLALKFIVSNNGSAKAQPVSLHAVQPNGWKVSFQPAQIASLAAGDTTQVTALITPPDTALAGDYIVKLQAVSGPASDSEGFRITIRPSSLWGFIGVGIIALAVLVLFAAIWRFGRR